MEVVCTHSAVFSSLAPIWHHFGIKNGAGSGPRSSLNEVGSMLERLRGGGKPSRSSEAVLITVFSQLWCPKTRQENLHGVLGPAIMGIFGINRD